MYCKVSIVMPVLNGMPFFMRALDSVRKQTLKDIEILVVDAGSTDGTVTYVRQVIEKDSRVQLLHSKMKSMGYQYNLGIKSATGEYVGFVESDDYIEAEMFEDLYNTAVSYDYPESIKSDIYMFVDAIDGREFSLYYQVLPASRRYLYGKTVSMNSFNQVLYRDVNMWNGIYRKEFLVQKKITLNETRGAAFQDMSFIEQVHLLAQREVFLNKAYYHYRRDNTNASSFKDVTPFVIQEFEYMLEFLIERPQVRDLYSPMVMSRLFGFFNNVAGNVFHAEDRALWDMLEELKETLKRFLNEIDDNQRLSFLHDFWLYAFLNETKTYIKMRSIFLKKMKEEREEFKKYISKYNQMIIVGAGEGGQSFYAFLRTNGYKGVVCFCDNNEILHNTNLMGLRIISVLNAVKTYPDGLFVISVKRLFGELSDQLQRNGISTENIIETIDVGPHTSMELRW